MNSGLNIVEAGQIGFGFNSNASKYSKITILKVFSLLYRTKLPQTKIAKKLKLYGSLVQDISKGNSHLWLKELYKEKYELMIDNNKSRRANSKSAKSLGRVYTPLI